MVAPVRETCAQTLGVALHHMNETGVSMTVDVLLKLLKEDQWEARHGGLLGIKYALAVRQVPPVLFVYDELINKHSRLLECLMVVCVCGWQSKCMCGDVAVKDILCNISSYIH